MKDGVRFLIYLCIIISFALMIMVSGLIGYKNGQVDALNGEIRYELVQQSDKSTRWDLIIKRESEK